MNRTTRLKKPQIPELETLYEFDDLGGRPKYGGVEMTSETNIPSFDEIRDETHSAVIAEATARDDADEELQTQIDATNAALAEATESLSDDIDQIADDLTAETAARAAADTDEANTRAAADNSLQSQIDAIVAGSDVKDIVDSYAELQAYDKTTLGDNDIIEVLSDETHDNATSYYRFIAAENDFEYVGSVSAGYTKAEADALLADKVDKVQGKQLSTEDYTTAEKTKLAGIEAGAEVNTIESVSVNGTAVTPDANKNVDLTIDGGIKTLTSADANYPANNPTQIYAWKLPTGAYIAPTDGTPIKGPKDETNYALMDIMPGTLFQVIRVTSSSANIIFQSGRYGSFGSNVYVRAAGVNPLDNTGDRTGFYILGAYTDNLTSSNASRALSAAQGSILNTRIGDLSTLTTTAKTSAVAAINELDTDKADKTAFTGTDGTTAGAMGLVPAPATTDAGKFLKADGSWGEAGGGITTLTAADYNYHYGGTTDDGVALWRLPFGIYSAEDGVKLYVDIFDYETVGKKFALVSRGKTSSLVDITITHLGYENGSAGIKSTCGVLKNSGAKQDLGKTFGSDRSALLIRESVQNSFPSNTDVINYRRFYEYSPLSTYLGYVLNNNIGDLSTLTTAAKTSTVAAINELDAEMPAITMSSTDPGEGAPLAANNFIAYYE